MEGAAKFGQYLGTRILQNNVELFDFGQFKAAALQYETANEHLEEQFEWSIEIWIGFQSARAMRTCQFDSDWC